MPKVVQQHEPQCVVFEALPSDRVASVLPKLSLSMLIGCQGVVQALLEVGHSALATNIIGQTT